MLEGDYSNPTDPDDELAQLWIGARRCRYKHSAEISLYGAVEDMEEGWFGRKYLHVSQSCKIAYP